MSRCTTLSLAVLLVAAAAGPGAGELAAQRQRDVITREEILQSPQVNQDLHALVRSLRPHFLRPPRGVRSVTGMGAPAPVALFVDGVNAGDAERGLKLLMASQVQEVRYLDPSKAQDQFGTEFSGGAVAVKLLKPAGPGG